MDKFETQFETKSQWSMDLATLQRIHYLLLQCTQSSTEDNIIAWYKAVVNLYKETYPFILRNKEFSDTIPKLKLEIEKEYTNYLMSLDSYNVMRDMDKKRYGLYYTGKILPMLENFEIELRLVLDHYDLLLKKVETGGYAVG